MSQQMLGMSVLYVEDDLVIQENTAKTLCYFFENVIVAANGLEALAILKETRPDVLITDYVMPHMNGYDLILEAQKLYPNLIIFVTSSYTDQDKLLKCMTLGLADYLVKPINYEKFIISIQNAMKKANEAKDPTQILLAQNIVCDLKLKCIIVDGVQFPLSKHELDLIQLFIKNKGNILSKAFIMGHLYGEIVDDNLLKNTIYRLRKKIGHDIFITMKNIGYGLK